jgi:hypothetical protein
VTLSAISAREEIGRAMADKIREFTTAKDLKKIAEDVLPEVEKFLESPAEKRLRRIRNGTMMAFIGIGGTIGLIAFAAATRNPQMIFLAGAGVVTFCIGIAMVINGYLLTVPKPEKEGQTSAEFAASMLGGTTSDLKLPAGEPPRPFRSVTESTTTHLAEKQPIPRD